MGKSTIGVGLKPGKILRNERRKNTMNAFDYVVERIDGDYAYLKRTDVPEEEEKMVARALLPEEIAEGTKLHYEFMMYSIVE